jgi:hypothetical protein
VQCYNIPAVYIGTVHLPAAFHQIMSLINKKNIIPRNVISKEPLQMYIGIKGIIIIADHSVCPDGKVQTHLKRTYLPFLSMFPDHFPGIYFFRCPQFINRIIHTVKMPLCIRAFLRGTLWRIKKTQLLFGCNGGHFKFQAFLPQNTKSLLCYCSCDRLGCKVKKRLTFSLSDGTYSRKNS